MLSKYALYLGLLFYSVLAAIFLVLFNTSFITSLLVLFVVPMVWWWHELYPPKSFLYGVLTLSLTTTLLFESVAHVSGAWYSVGEGVFRLFGLIPLEAFFLTFVQFIFLILLHEFFVDDKRLHSVRLDSRRKRMFWLLGGLSLAGLLQATLFTELRVPFAFGYLLLGIVVTLGVAALLSHRRPRAVFEKALLTVILTAPLLLLYEVVALNNVYTVYANTSAYLSSISVSGETLPLEKLLQLFVLPLFVVTVYELYFDDAQ